MKSFSAFLPRILPYLPGCSEPLVNQALLNAAIEFCEATNVLRQNLDTFDTVVGEVQYDLYPPTSQHTISRVMSVSVNGVDLAPGMAEVIRNDLPTQNAMPRGFYTDRTDSLFTLRLSPPPDKVYPVVVNVALRPTITATQLEDDLFNIWIDPLVNGAIARCMMIPDQPFTNYGMAQQLMKTAESQITNSRIEGNYGLIRGSMRVRSRPFATR